MMKIFNAWISQELRLENRSNFIKYFVTLKSLETWNEKWELKI